MNQLKQFLTNGATHWKSTLQSILTVTIAVSAYLAANPQTGLPIKVTGTIMAAGSIAKIIVGISQQDYHVEVAK